MSLHKSVNHLDRFYAFLEQRGMSRLSGMDQRIKVKLSELLACDQLKGDGETTVAYYLYNWTHDAELVARFTKYHSSPDRFVKRLATSQTPVDCLKRGLLDALSYVVVNDTDEHTRYKALDRLLRMRGVHPSADRGAAHSVWVRHLSVARDAHARKELIDRLDRDLPLE